MTGQGRRYHGRRREMLHWFRRTLPALAGFAVTGGIDPNQLASLILNLGDRHFALVKLAAAATAAIVLVAPFADWDGEDERRINPATPPAVGSADPQSGLDSIEQSLDSEIDRAEREIERLIRDQVGPTSDRADD